MHFEILTEDQSSKKAMDILLPKLLENRATYRTISYRGIGYIPKGLQPKTDAQKRILLDRLPELLRGYGRSLFEATLVIICDLDDKDHDSFLFDLNQILASCNPKPETLFCLAIEEFEAWYLGDLEAVRKAYPRAKNNILSSYVNDSICGTWELLADAICQGGSKALSKKGWQAIGGQKSVWAEVISPLMDIDNNYSPSFNTMRVQIQEAAKYL